MSGGAERGAAGGRGGSREAGLYVHVPFCLTRCGYCDFNTYAGLDHLAPAYARALVDEAGLHAPSWAAVSFVSIFLGGGTPTMLPPDAIAALLAALRERFDLRPVEVTSEANPDTVDAESLAALLAAGVTRLSVGVQSFDPEVLRALERVHSPDSARGAVRAARTAGFEDVSLDLIYGAHGETRASWRRTLDEALALEPEHLSCYALTIEPSTALGRAVAAGVLPPPDPDLQAAMYDEACERLAGAGFVHYEVSNWARPGRECVHNRGYWEGRPYLGLGAGAHSYDGTRRWWNVRPPSRYVDLVAAGRPPVGGGERLGEEERRVERLLLGLRTSRGVPAAWVDEDRVAPFLAEGLAERRDGRVVLNDRGMLVANEVVLALAG